MSKAKSAKKADLVCTECRRSGRRGAGLRIAQGPSWRGGYGFYCEDCGEDQWLEEARRVRKATPKPKPEVLGYRVKIMVDGQPHYAIVRTRLVPADERPPPSSKNECLQVLAWWRRSFDIPASRSFLVRVVKKRSSIGPAIDKAVAEERAAEVRYLLAVGSADDADAIDNGDHR